MRRLLVAVAVTTAFAVLPTQAAVATAPVQIRISEPASFVLPGSDFCGFDVRVDLQQKFKAIFFAHRQGWGFTGLTAGKIKATFTNLESGGSTSISIPGPGFLDTSGLPIVGTGPWVIFVPGRILYLVGHIRFRPTSYGVDVASLRGRMLDLCTVLR
jgi:hypothetical protein